MTHLTRTVLLLAGLAVLLVLAWSVGITAVLDMIQRVGWAFLWVSALYTLHVGLRALALWRSLSRNLLGFRDVLRVRLAGEAIEMLTFTGPFLAEPSKGWLLTERGIETAEAFGAIAVEYLLYTAVAFWMAGASLTVLIVRGVFGPAFDRSAFVVLASLAVFTAGLVCAALFRQGLVTPAIRWAGRVFDRAPWIEATAAKVEPVEGVLVGFMHDRPARLLEVLGVEVAGHALLAMEIWVALRAIGAPVTWMDAFVLEGAIKLIAAVFFFVPGQLGAAEGVYVVLANGLKFGSAAGLTLALVRRLRALIVAAVGLGVLATDRKRPSQATVRGLSP